MAVVNSPYIGIARGRLGEGVFSRVKGQTTVRGYNPSPANPRMPAQQAQRAQFSSAVKFFSRGVQNFFKFAFENKAEKESDYNAFMRFNANRGMYFGPEQNQTPEYPALGRFVMTKGSLPSPTYDFDDGTDTFSAIFPYKGTFPTASTLGALSQLLLTAGYQQGDIVTFCTIQTDCIPGDSSQPVAEWGGVPVWDIRQFTIDVSSTASAFSLGVNFSQRDEYTFRVNLGQELVLDYACAGCVCISRPMQSGLKVSSSVLWLNQAAQMILIYGQSPTWKAAVLQAWRTQGESILQGSQSVNSIASFNYQFVADGELPKTIPAEGSLALYFNQAIQLGDLVGHLVFVFNDTPYTASEVASSYLEFTNPSGQQLPIRGAIHSGEPDILYLENTDTSDGFNIANIYLK